MSELAILKLGGSVITDKSGACAIDHARLRTIAADIVMCRDRSLLLIHGAGSCGHPQAKYHHLDRGMSPGETKGVYETHAAVRLLNAAVVEALRSKGVEAIGIPPLGMGVTEGGRLASFAHEPLARMLEAGIVPVLHGDVMMDRIQGASILSGDQLVVYLALALNIRRVGLATDVPGVLWNGTVISCLHPEDAVNVSSSRHADVTGGMEGKVTELCTLAREGVESHIFHVTRIRDFLNRSDHGGTVIRRRAP
jgi:isopentenyl phosphate kinase